MLSLSNATRGATAELLQQAVHRNSIFTARRPARARLHARLPEPGLSADLGRPGVDLEALEITPALPRASRSPRAAATCMSYLVADPGQHHGRRSQQRARRAHPAEARRRAPSRRATRSSTASSATPTIPQRRSSTTASCGLGSTSMTRALLGGPRSRSGRRRIDAASRGLYRFGLLGRFIGVGASRSARALRRRPARDADGARPCEEQREIFARTLAPLSSTGWCAGSSTTRPRCSGSASRRRNIDALAGGSPGGMARA